MYLSMLPVLPLLVKELGREVLGNQEVPEIQVSWSLFMKLELSSEAVATSKKKSVFCLFVF